jgi:hypothetical protein
MLQYLIVCPLVFLAGFVDAIGGGGGLISLPAYMIAGLPAHTAIATNKLSSAMGTTVSTARFAKNGYIPWKLSLSSAVMALIGSCAGANLSLLVNETIIQNTMIVILPIAAFYVLRSKNMGDNERTNTLPFKKMLLISMLTGLIVGAYDGFYGPGTGTFCILLLTGLARMDMKTAAGTTKVMNLTSNIAALITFIINGKVYYPLGLVSGIFSIAGHYIGSGLVTKNGRKIVRPIILVVLTILFLKILLGY